MRNLDISGAIWVDHSGVTRKVPAPGKLRFPKIPLHAALRAFVYIRDGFACQWCGATPDVIPSDYDGRHTLELQKESKTGFSTCLVIDHVLSRRNGGTNHPNNLQTLCEGCNAAKAGLVDAKHGRVS